MRSFIYLLATCALFNLADAQTPAPNSPPASSASPAPATKAPDSKAPDSTVVTVKVQEPPANTAPAPVSPETIKAARDAGYTVKTRKGHDTQFCKSEQTIGSHFSKETCLNEEQMNSMLLATQQERDRLKSTLGSGASGH